MPLLNKIFINCTYISNQNICKSFVANRTFYEERGPIAPTVAEPAAI